MCNGNEGDVRLGCNRYQRDRRQIWRRRKMLITRERGRRWGRVDYKRGERVDFREGPWLMLILGRRRGSPTVLAVNEEEVDHSG